MSEKSLFWSRGYLPIGRVSTPAQITVLKNELTSLLSEELIPEDHLMRSDDGHIRVALHLCHLSGAFRTHALNDRIWTRISTLFDGEPHVLTSLLFDKPPRVGLPLAFHQDLPYYPYLGNDDLVTCWTALDPVDATNGRVEYVPASHRQHAPHRQTGQQQALDIDPQLLDLSALDGVSLEPGEAVLHHGLTVHRSGANTSDRPRAGIATLYIRSSARVSREDFPYPLISARTGVTDAHS